MKQLDVRVKIERKDGSEMTEEFCEHLVGRLVDMMEEEDCLMGGTFVVADELELSVTSLGEDEIQ